MSVNEKMTAIANEVRTISNTDEVMGLDKMAEYLNDANTEVNSQTDLIAQIQSALQGKAAGSGGGDASVKTCTVTVTGINSAFKVAVIATSVGSDGKPISYFADEITAANITIDCVCGTPFIFIDRYYVYTVDTDNFLAEFSHVLSLSIHTYVTPSNHGDTASINLTYEQTGGGAL